MENVPINVPSSVSTGPEIRTYGTEEDALNSTPTKDEPSLTKGNSILVVFSLWSTMVGSTLLAMPRIVRDVGIVPALCASAMVCVINGYTATIVEALNQRIAFDTAAILRYFHRNVLFAGVFSSCFILVGAMMLYHIYICDTLLAFAEISTSNMTWRPAASICIAVAVWLVSLLRRLDPLLKAASYCVIITGFIIVFIVVKAWHELVTNDDCTGPDVPSVGTGFTTFGYLLKFTSAIALSLFIHPILGSITTVATKKKNNNRDIGIAFLLTSCSVVLPACFATYAFKNCNELKDDYIVMFDDPFAMVGRVAIILLIGIIYPILLFNARNQFLSVVYGEEFPYWLHITMNTVILVMTTAPCAINMETTVVAASSGVVALFWALILPVALYLYLRYKSRSELDRMSSLFVVAHIFIMVFGAFLIAGVILSIAGVL